MKKAILSILLIGATCFNGDLEASKNYVHNSPMVLGLEYTVVRVKHSLKKVGIISHLYIDIGTSPTHSLSGSVSVVEDGAFKIGFGKDIVILSNEVDMLNYFTRNGWEIVKISDLILLSNNYTQYLFSKESR